MTGNRITIQGLRVASHIGVPDVERATAQTLTLNIVIYPVGSLENLHDEIVGTIDYFRVSEGVKQIAGARPRRLIETLAEDIANALLEEFDLRAVEIEVRKYVLPDTEYVSVHLTKHAETS